MGINSKIEWCDDTWNPWHGCRKVSTGCKYCYMFRDKERYGQEPTIVLKSKTNFKFPLRRKEPLVIFTCSWSDFFIEDADPWRDEAWEIIRQTPQHLYLILTKRPERIRDHLPKDWGVGYDNVWLGISAENQEMFDIRGFILNNIPAIVKFISFEPLLEKIEWREGKYNNISWAIIGGESGNKTGLYRYRKMEFEWVKNLIKQAKKQDAKVFVKQMGTYLAKRHNFSGHGNKIEEWPEELQIREWPDRHF